MTPGRDSFFVQNFILLFCSFFFFFFLQMLVACVGGKEGRKRGKPTHYVASIMNLHSISRTAIMMPEGSLPTHCHRETGRNATIWSVYRPSSLMTYHIQKCVDHFFSLTPTEMQGLGQYILQTRLSGDGETKCHDTDRQVGNSQTRFCSLSMYRHLLFPISLSNAVPNAGGAANARSE